MPTDPDWLKKWSIETPEAVAIKHGERAVQYSYRELFYLSCALANYLKNQLGVKSGERVAIFSPNEIEFFPLFLGIQRLGAIFVPINYRLATPEIEAILKNCSPSVLIYHSRFHPLLASIARASRPHHEISMDQVGGLQSFFETELAQLRTDPEYLQTAVEREIPYLVEFEEPAMILYTSGTTGVPKGVVITPKMMHWNAVSTQERVPISSHDTIVSFLPLFHTSGWNVFSLPFLYRGAKIIFVGKFDAEKVLALNEAEEATLLFGVPTTMAKMAYAPNFQKTSFKSLRYAVVGGESMPVELIHRWQERGVRVRQGFGLTEFGPNVFSLHEDDSLKKIGSIGFVNPYIEVRVVDADGRDVVADEVGELLLKGPMCSPGYWQDAEATSLLIRDGWLATGDLVRFDKEGYCFIAGRKKEMFISGGENVYPAEIERVLSAHPEIREVAVIGVADETWGEVGKAFIRLQDDSRLDGPDVRNYCVAHLAKYKIPKHFAFHSSLPKGASGKSQNFFSDKTRMLKRNPTEIISF